MGWQFIMFVCIVLTTVATTDRQHAARTSEKDKLVNLEELSIFILLFEFIFQMDFQVLNHTPEVIFDFFKTIYAAKNFLTCWDDYTRIIIKDKL